MADRCGPNLAPSALISAQRLTVAAAATGQATRLVVDLPWSEFTEAYQVTVVNLPTQEETDAAAALFLVQTEDNPGAETTALMLPNCEVLGAGCTVHQALPGWAKQAVIDVIGVNLFDFTERREVSVNVIVKRLDRTVREERKIQ